MTTTERAATYVLALGAARKAIERQVMQAYEDAQVQRAIEQPPGPDAPKRMT